MMSHRGKRQAPTKLEDVSPIVTKRRKGRVTKAPEEDETSSIEKMVSDMRMPNIYNRTTTDAPAELFRKDLISAMKLPDSEPLTPDDYYVITDQWKQEWERGVQVPVNPDSLPRPVVNVLENNRFSSQKYYHRDFKLPKNKYIRITKDEHFKVDDHYLSNVAILADKCCAYDLDDLDVAWLGVINNERSAMGLKSINEDQLERIIEEFEMRCWERVQEILKKEEGIALEYDESVICDVCRSPDSEDGNEMVFCDCCNICVHQACYGITSIPSGSWLCRTCALGLRPECVLCPNKNGAMKSTRSGHKWAHVSCALWIPEVSIGCVEKMEPITKISSVPQSRWALICVLCRERVGACIQCSVKTCKVAYHVTCAFKHGLEMRAIIDSETAQEDDNTVKLRSYCQKHSLSTKKEGSGSASEDESKKVARKDMTTEEKCHVRASKIHEIQGEFEKHVAITDIKRTYDVDKEGLKCIYNYWILKRRSQFNRPLLAPKYEDNDLLSKNQEQVDQEKMRMFVQLRQDLERVRNLCYMVSRREKLNRMYFRMREDTFYKQVSIITNPKLNLSTEEIEAVRHANHGPSVYDQIYSHPSLMTKKADVDFESFVSTIVGGISDIKQRTTTVNGLVKKKHIRFNGSMHHKGATGGGYGSMSSGSELDIKHPTFESDTTVGSLKVTTSNKSQRKSTIENRIKNTARRRKEEQMTRLINDSSTEDDDRKPIRHSPRNSNRTSESLSTNLNRFEKNLRTRTVSSDSDDLILKTNFKPIIKRSASDIYSSDSDAKTTKKTETKISSKRLTVDPKKKPQDRKPKKSKSPKRFTNKNSNEKLKSNSSLTVPTELIVPQRKAAKKATETLLRSQGKKLESSEIDSASVTAVKKSPIGLMENKKLLKSKEKSPRISNNSSLRSPKNLHTSGELSSEKSNIDCVGKNDSLELVPQRLAARKATEHIMKNGLVIKNEPGSDQVIKTEVNAAQIDKRKSASNSGSSSSSSSSGSSSSSSSSGSSSSSSSSTSSSSSSSSSSSESDGEYSRNKSVLKGPFYNNNNLLNKESNKVIEDKNKIIIDSLPPPLLVSAIKNEELIKNSPFDTKPQNIDTNLIGRDSKQLLTNSEKEPKPETLDEDFDNTVLPFNSNLRRSLFSPQLIKDNIPLPTDLLDFNDDDDSKSIDEFGLDKNDTSSLAKLASLSFPFSSDFLFKEDSKEDTTRETLNLVEKLKMGLARRTGGSNESFDYIDPVATPFSNILDDKEPPSSEVIVIDDESSEEKTQQTPPKSSPTSSTIPPPPLSDTAEPPSSTALPPLSTESETEQLDTISKVTGRDKLDRSVSGLADERWVPPSQQPLPSFDPTKWSDSVVMPSRRSDCSSSPSSSVRSVNETINENSSNSDLKTVTQIDQEQESAINDLLQLPGISNPHHQLFTHLPHNIFPPYAPLDNNAHQNSNNMFLNNLQSPFSTKPLIEPPPPPFPADQNYCNSSFSTTGFNFPPFSAYLTKPLEEILDIQTGSSNNKENVTPLSKNSSTSSDTSFSSGSTLTTTSSLDNNQNFGNNILNATTDEIYRAIINDSAFLPSSTESSFTLNTGKTEPFVYSPVSTTKQHNFDDSTGGAKTTFLSNVPANSAAAPFMFNSEPFVPPSLISPTSTPLFVTSSSAPLVSSNSTHPVVSMSASTSKSVPALSSSASIVSVSTSVPFVAASISKPVSVVSTSVPTASISSPVVKTSVSTEVIPTSIPIESKYEYTKENITPNIPTTVLESSSVEKQSPSNSSTPSDTDAGKYNKKSPTKPIRISARVLSQIKSPAGISSPRAAGATPSRSPAAVVENVKKPKEKQRNKAAKTNVNRRGRGRGRSKNVNPFYSPRFDCDTIQSKLVGTVYDFDFDEELNDGHDGLGDLKALRERRKSIDISDSPKLILSPTTSSSSSSSKRKVLNTPDTRDLKPPSPPLEEDEPVFNHVDTVTEEDEEESVENIKEVDVEVPEEEEPEPSLPPISKPAVVLPPDPVDNNLTIMDNDTSSNIIDTDFNLRSFQSLPVVDQVSDMVDDLEKEFLQSYSKPVETECYENIPILPTVVTDVIGHEVTDDRYQLKMKIKGPFLDPNYAAALSQPQPIIEGSLINAVVNVTTSGGGSTSSSLRRMRKKELLRQYCNQDMNIDEPAPSSSMMMMMNGIPPNPHHHHQQVTISSSFPSPSNSRPVITIPKAVASISSLPTKEHYNVYNNSAHGKEKGSNGKKRDKLDPVDDEYYNESPEKETAKDIIIGNKNENKEQLIENNTWKRKSKTQLPAPPVASAPPPKLKIKIGSSDTMPTVVTTTTTTTTVIEEKNLRLRPPKKRICEEPRTIPTIEQLRRDHMQYRCKVISEFDEEEVSSSKKRKNKSNNSKSTKHKKKQRNNTVPHVQLIPTEKCAPKLIIRFSGSGGGGKVANESLIVPSTSNGISRLKNNPDVNAGDNDDNNNDNIKNNNKNKNSNSSNKNSSNKNSSNNDSKNSNNNNYSQLDKVQTAKISPIRLKLSRYKEGYITSSCDMLPNNSGELNSPQYTVKN